MMSKEKYKNTTTVLLGFTLVVILGFEVILNLTPPISRDALIHHLAIPKLWLKHGGFYEISWANFSYYPMNIDLFYLICLYFKNDIIPKFIHLFFGLGIGWLIFKYLNKKTGRNWGLLGAVIFISTPIVIWLSTSAYVDLGMTFFITGSLLAFIKWRDSEYTVSKWLYLSAICMGLAIGSKYNALIAFFFTNLVLIYSYAKDTGKQISSLKYGLLFFIITVVVSLPWYLKNFYITGNPFYPLFESFFKSLHNQPITNVVHDRMVRKSGGGVGFFRLRQVMYGESFLETLLIPLRMFFQGDDTSYRYFQGVLSPILIVFTPFLIFNKTHKRDNILFLSFSVFFILMAFFLTAKQVRYLLPTIPFLAICAVSGIKSADDRLKNMICYSDAGWYKYVQVLTRIVLFVSIALMLGRNLLYLNNRIIIIDPVPYVLNRETRSAFLNRNLEHYAAVEYMNKYLPENAKIFTMFLGRRGYYLNRYYKNEPSFGQRTLDKMMKSANQEESFNKFIQSTGVTHIFMRSAVMDKYLNNTYSKKKIVRFMILVKKHWKMVYAYNGYSVWDIRI